MSSSSTRVLSIRTTLAAILVGFLCSLPASAQLVIFSGPDVSATRSGPVNFDIILTTPDAVLTANQVTVVRTGTANAASVVVLPGRKEQRFIIRLSNITGNGTLSVRVQQSSSQSYPVTVDNTPPVVTIGPPNTFLVPKGGMATYILNYEDAFNVNLRASDITLVRTGTANAEVTVPDNTSIQPAVVLSNFTGNGTVAISVAAGRSTDFVGNPDIGTATSAAIIVDSDGPVASIGAPIITDPLVQAFTYVVSYTGASSNELTVDHIVLGTDGTATGNVKVLRPTTALPIIQLTDVAGTGSLWVTVLPGSSRDLAGNIDEGAGPSEAVEIFTGGSPDPNFHSLDQDRDNMIELGGLLRVVQLYNAREFHCAPGAEDGYEVGPAPEKAVYKPCYQHSSDYRTRDFHIELRELLRAIQLYYAGAYYYCPERFPRTEDNFCLGNP